MSYVVKLRRRTTVGDAYTKDEEDSALASSPVFSNFIRPCTVEFFGTAVYTFFSSLVLLTIYDFANTHPSDYIQQIGNQEASGSPPLRNDLSLLFVSFAQSFTMALLIIMFGHVSGGHFNPAITLGSWLSGGIKLVLAAFYFICQLFGGFIGALMVRTVINRPAYILIEGGVTYFDKKLATKGQAILLELITTFTVVLSYLMTAVDGGGTDAGVTAGAVGLSVLIGTMTSFQTTRAGMNPAKSLGCSSALSIFADADSGEWTYHYVYWVGPLLGAIMAALAYRLMLARDEKRWVFRR